MFSDALEPFLDKLVTLWVGPVMYPGKLSNIDHSDQCVLVESHQYKGQMFVVSIPAITAISCDSNVDTVEKFETLKKEQEEKQRAAAAEYRRQAEELEKEQLNDSGSGKRAS